MARTAVFGLAAIALGLASLVAPRAQERVTAFVNVHVVPMDREVVLRDQTVIISGARIAQIGPSSHVKAPAGAMVVQGTGKYLTPGLAEMHAHLTGDNDALNERILLLNIGRGVTTIRGMLGHPSHLALRERVRKGELIGPTIYTSGPSLNGNTVPDEATARRLVEEQKAAGYDFLKIHPGMRRGPFDALAETAHRLAIGFSGHVPVDVGLDRALDARYRSIDHLDGYVEALLKEGAPVDPKQPGFFGLAFIDHLDESRIAALVAKTKAAGVWNVPTQSLMPAFMGRETTEALAARPEMRYLPRQMTDQWIQSRDNFLKEQGDVPLEKRQRFVAVRARIIKALDDADAGVLLGADTPQVMQVPGWATHGELKALVASGLSPYRALRAGTISVARFFGTSDRTGSVTTGKEASLILVDGNPLDEVGNMGRISGVMVRGRWITAAEQERMLARTSGSAAVGG
jgi:imidazolonepropionase-like amidohydrolase